MRYTILIPARLASTRLPNKPLADIGGLPMVVRVAQRVQSLTDAQGPFRVVVVADSASIVLACEAQGVQALLTRADHASGSDRLAEACKLLALADEEIVVNVQGDEPLIEPSLVSAVAHLLGQRKEASIATAAHAIKTQAEFVNPNVVKVVLDASGLAQYFSRAPIPYWRERPNALALSHPAPLRHIGIYAYRVAFLSQFPTLVQAPLEQLEALEQLRAMWHGHRIAVHVTPQRPVPGVDTPEDLARVRQLFQA